MIKITYSESLVFLSALAIIVVLVSVVIFGLWHPMWAISLLFVWKGLPWLLRNVVQVAESDAADHPDADGR